MVSLENLRQMALAYPETFEKPHFDRMAFYAGKRIFATYDPKTNQANLKLTLIDQDVFHKFDPLHIFPVPNKWGQAGMTTFCLAKMRIDLFADALQTAYANVMNKA
ncbi:MmcQ/YjbR family DNA-binding protein [Pedobacter sp. KR3-3]|uniref:MmcQ/YjbR family DNA-binding protein n=1 Tax=Pedobacter albus TaxID=3113905 RepID=A0ABU7I8F2_9SPHI|nr:MmcQ/YjbR family DNA-binding protein [Pedobacter sp. KR3-3]MEE1945755.1 MmcQ/YjbR family DNA-binding protein [Pedobacter sp. KR3-3]